MPDKYVTVPQVGKGVKDMEPIWRAFFCHNIDLLTTPKQLRRLIYRALADLLGVNSNYYQHESYLQEAVRASVPFDDNYLPEYYVRAYTSNNAPISMEDVNTMASLIFDFPLLFP